MNHAATAYFFHVNNNINQKLNKMNTEKDYNHIAVKQHTKDMLSSKYPFLHKTPDNENTYIIGFNAGILFAINEMDELRKRQELKKEESPTLNRYYGADEENLRTLHY